MIMKMNVSCWKSNLAVAVLMIHFPLTLNFDETLKQSIISFACVFLLSGGLQKKNYFMSQNICVGDDS